MQDQKSPPSTLRRNTKLEQKLESHAFFQSLTPGLIQELSSKLKARLYNDKDYVIRKGEVGRAMFIVVKGTIDVVSDDGLFPLVSCTQEISSGR